MTRRSTHHTIEWTSAHGHAHTLRVGVYEDVDEFRLDLGSTGLDTACSNLTRDAAEQLHAALTSYLSRTVVESGS